MSLILATLGCALSCARQSPLCPTVELREPGWPSALPGTRELPSNRLCQIEFHGPFAQGTRLWISPDRGAYQLGVERFEEHELHGHTTTPLPTDIAMRFVRLCHDVVTSASTPPPECYARGNDGVTYAFAAPDSSRTILRGEFWGGAPPAHFRNETKKHPVAALIYSAGLATDYALAKQSGRPTILKALRDQSRSWSEFRSR